MDPERFVSEQPLVSVVMNCYNGGKYLREAIASVRAQTYQNLEVIFWDNQSTDQSAEIFRSYDDSRLRYFYAPTHSLLYKARNHAINKASGEFIAFLDVDDWWRADKLESQIPLFADPEVGFACSNYWVVREGHRRHKLFKRSLPSGWVLNDILTDYPVGLLTLVLRRTAFDGLLGGCDPRFHICGDMELVVRLAMKWKMAACQESLAWYRIHGDNESPKHRARSVTEYQMMLDKLGTQPGIVGLSGYKRLEDQHRYLQARLLINEEKLSDAVRQMKELPWGEYKVKLMLLLVKAYLL
jgi:glycosyltransferase involved in cell wall biosynthesis